jgi:hypothetical protein
MKFAYLFAVLPMMVWSQGNVIEAKDSKNAPNDPRAILVYEFQIDELLKSARSFQGGTEGLYKNDFSREWAFRIVSDSSKARFFRTSGTNIGEQMKTKLVQKMEGAKSIVAPKINLFKPADKDFMSKNTVLEKLISEQLEPQVIIKKSGLLHSDWQVVLSPLGTPDHRYKDGALWVRNPKDDHPYCQVIYYRIKEIYQGSSYGSSAVSNATPYLCGCE